MWLATLVQLLALAAVEPAAAGNSPLATTTPPAIFTRQTAFTIPFHIERPQSITQEPVDVQLFVSADRGVTWQLYGKTEPIKQQFVFRAQSDGEYWFQVRTLDRSGQLHPDGPAAPGLCVLVDTTPPKLQLDLHRGPTGEVVVRWQIDELYPKPGSLTLQYRTAAEHAWQPMTLARAEPGPSGPVQTGEMPLYPPVNLSRLEVRAQAADMAGNTAQREAQINLQQPRTTTPPPAMTAANTPGRPPVAAAGEADAWRASAPDLPPTNWPGVKGAAPNQPNNNGNPPPADLAPSPLRPSPNHTQVAFSGDGKTDFQDGSVAIHINPAAVTTTALAMHAAAPPAVPAPSFAQADLPAGEKPHMVNSRVFELEYDVESVGPSGIKQVELWGTRDGGHTWKRFAIDQSKHSPLLVTVAEEGVYGFRVVVQSGAGLGGKPPQSGDAPEIWIGVDLTKPAVRITSAEQGSGADTNNLNIAWEATDNLLAARPIALSFSETTGGPWLPIASSLENTGRYAWAIDSRTPPRVYLRLEARDEAGNVGVYETPQPVSLDRMSPKVHIRDVRPLGQGG